MPGCLASVSFGCAEGIRESRISGSGPRWLGWTCISVASVRLARTRGVIAVPIYRSACLGASASTSRRSASCMAPFQPAGRRYSIYIIARKKHKVKYIACKYRPSGPSYLSTIYSRNATARLAVNIRASFFVGGTLSVFSTLPHSVHWPPPPTHSWGRWRPLSVLYSPRNNNLS